MPISKEKLWQAISNIVFLNRITQIKFIVSINFVYKLVKKVDI